MSVPAPRSGAARIQFGGGEIEGMSTNSDFKGVKCKGLTSLLTYTPLRPGWSQSTVSRSSSSQLTWSSHSCSVSGWVKGSPMKPASRSSSRSVGGSSPRLQVGEENCFCPCRLPRPALVPPTHARARSPSSSGRCRRGPCSARRQQGRRHLKRLVLHVGSPAGTLTSPAGLPAPSCAVTRLITHELYILRTIAFILVGASTCATTSASCLQLFRRRGAALRQAAAALRLGCVCGRRLGRGSCVSVRQARVWSAA